MNKIFLGLALLFLSGCYQTLKSSYPYESCLAHASGSIPFVNVQDCAQRAVSAWQSKDPNLRVERNPYLDAYVNDLVDQVRRGQVSDSRARLMFAQKVNELNAAAYRQKEYEEEKRRRDWLDAADSLNQRDANGCLLLDAACRAGSGNTRTTQSWSPPPGVKYPYESETASGQSKYCVYKSGSIPAERKILTLRVHELCPSMY